MKQWHALATVFLLSVGTAGCLDDITATRPLTLEVEANPTTATVGEVITFTATATGTRLREITFEFGDGGGSEKTYPGFVEITDYVEHAYSEPGTYVTTAQAVADQGTISDEVTVVVN